MSSPDFCNGDSEPQGDCFHAAFKTLMDMATNLESDEFLLVHGNPAHLSQNVDVNHAWVENTSTVFDYSNGGHIQMPKDEYYSQLQITATRRYTLIEAMKMEAQHVHYGPWPQ